MPKPLQINAPATTRSSRHPANQQVAQELDGSPEAYMKAGIALHVQCVGHVIEAKRAAALAGGAFIMAKEQVKAGDWADWCRASGVAATTCDNYIRWYKFVIEVGRVSMPGLDDPDRLLERGIEAVMPSPKAWTSLMRYNGLLEKQGQYDPEAYRQAKTHPQQLEFDWGLLSRAVLQIRTIPSQRDVPVDRLKSLRDELAAALAVVEKQITQMTGSIDA